MHLFQLKYICQVSQGYYVEVSQIGSENVEAFSCGNFSAAKDPVLGGGLQCFVSVVIAISTPSTRGKHHQIKTHSTGNHKILQISRIWSKIWICGEHQWIKKWNDRKQKKMRLKTKPSAAAVVLWSFLLSLLVVARATSPDDDRTWWPPLPLLQSSTLMTPPCYHHLANQLKWQCSTMIKLLSQWWRPRRDAPDTYMNHNALVRNVFVCDGTEMTTALPVGIVPIRT